MQSSRNNKQLRGKNRSGGGEKRLFCGPRSGTEREKKRTKILKGVGGGKRKSIPGTYIDRFTPFSATYCRSNNQAVPTSTNINPKSMEVAGGGGGETLCERRFLKVFEAQEQYTYTHLGRMMTWCVRM